MNPNPLPEAPSDGTHIDITDEAGLRHWAQRLGTDPERLRAALAAVGNDMQQLRAFLSGAAVSPEAAGLLPDDNPHDANGPAGLPHYDIHKEAS